MDRRTENAILRLRAAGATRICVSAGSVEVEFAPLPAQQAETKPGTSIQAELDDAIHEIREHIHDAQHEQSISDKRKARMTANDLTYMHAP